MNENSATILFAVCLSSQGWSNEKNTRASATIACDVETCRARDQPLVCGLHHTIGSSRAHHVSTRWAIFALVRGFFLLEYP